MKKYKLSNDEEVELEDKDFLLITAIDNLADKINMLRMSNGR